MVFLHEVTAQNSVHIYIFNYTTKQDEKLTLVPLDQNFNSLFKKLRHKNRIFTL